MVVFNFLKTLTIKQRWNNRNPSNSILDERTRHNSIERAPSEIWEQYIKTHNYNS